MRETRWKCIFRDNFNVLPQVFDVGALIPQGLAGSPNYFGFLNTFVILINCESLGEIGYIAYVTPARSSHGQALKLRFISFLHATSSLRNQLFASFFFH